MPFGRHKGTPLEALPPDYVVWLSTLDLRDPLRSAVVVELGRRVLGQPSVQASQTRAPRRQPEAAVAAPEIHMGDDSSVPF